ncbi:hypothetical protein VTO42DRAFT_7628 [Malbranchea cinnamomea]
MCRPFAPVVAALLAALCARAAPENHRLLVAFPGDRAKIPGWHFLSSKDANGNVIDLSVSGVDVSDWYRMGPRGTIMAGLIESGVYDEDDLFFSDNLFTSVDSSAFETPWLYREEFNLVPKYGQHYFLETHGISSRADIYINGQLVASKDEQVGSYGGHKYEVTEYVRPGRNCILIQAYPTNYLRDLAIGFVDWNPYPPDNGTGVWRNVEFSQTGSIAIMSPIRVVTDFRDPSAHRVKVTVKVDVRNVGGKPVTGKVDGYVQDLHSHRRIPIFTKISLAPGEDQTASLDTVIEEPKIWWPASWGEQPLYEVALNVKVGSHVSDVAPRSTFGIRSVESHLNDGESVSFTVNGKPFLVMGAGYTSDIFMRFDIDRLKVQFQHMLDMGLNTVRLEGNQEHPELYDLADQMGLMVIAGWECCDKWEGWDYNDEGSGDLWKEEDYQTAETSMLHEAGLMQRHPSMLAFLVGSDFWPNDRATQIYVNALDRMDWRNPIISSAAKRGYPDLLGPSGMDMDGPYDWVPPNYWYGNQLGAAIGFGSELGAGAGTPNLRSLKKFLSPEDLDDLWTQPDKALFHMSQPGSQFDNRRISNQALYARYGAPRDLDDYLLKSQLMDYEATRAQFESYSARKSEQNPSTGLIYWMLNGAWPNLHWALFDYYLNPIATYFGTKVGTRTEHVAYDYQHRTLYLINHSLERKGPRTISVDLIDLEGNPLSSVEINANTSPNSSKHVGRIAGTDEISDVAFLRLILRDDESGVVLSRTVHWLSSKVDVLDWDNSTWYYTPVIDPVNFTALDNLAPASVKASIKLGEAGAEFEVKVVLENESDVPAFFLRLTALHGEEEIAPVYWSDNYVTLWPKETLELVVNLGENRCGDLAIEITGYNVETSLVDAC